MKRNFLLIGLISAILILNTACNQPKESSLATVDLAKIEAEIKEASNRFANIYNTGNADSLEYYADDAVSYFNNQYPIVGKKAIHEFIIGEIESLPKGVELKFETKELHISTDGNQVLEIGAHTLKDSTGALLGSGKYFSFFEKRNGKYVCIRDMGNADPYEE